MRLHTIIYALNRKVPVIGLSYDPKVDAVLDYANTGFRADVSDLDEAALIKAVDNIILNRDEISLKLSKTIEKLKEKPKLMLKMPLIL